jgi:FkbM family methyltransferase
MAGKRVFLDVGGHVGETLAVAMSPRWDFDRLCTFEPSSSCLPALHAIADDRVEVVQAGLWSSNTEMALHDPGTVSASVHQRRSTGAIETCRFVDAGQWMATHVSDADKVWMKINIEGAEVEVLDRLMDTGEIAKVDHLVVHFDVEKVGLGEEATYMRARLNAAGLPWREAKSVMFGRTTEAKTESWLLFTFGHRWAFLRRKVEHLARQRVWEARKRGQRGPDVSAEAPAPSA